MTKLIRPLTLKGSCLSFSNQDHDLGSTICRSRGHNATTYSSDVWAGLNQDQGCSDISELKKSLENSSQFYSISSLPSPSLRFTMYLSCKELQESLDQFFHFIAGKTEAKVTKKFISSSKGHLGQNTELSKIGTPTTFDQNGLSASTHTQGKAKRFLSLWDLCCLWTGFATALLPTIFQGKCTPFDLGTLHTSKDSWLQTKKNCFLLS